MEISQLLLLGGLGMLAVGAAPLYYWRREKGIEMKFFLLGGLFWLAAILVKVIMDLSVTGPLRTVMGGMFSGTYTFFIVFLALYFGLRTGLLECGLPYLFSEKAGIRRPSFEQAMAFGFGFGCTEAVALGALSLINVGFIILNPSLLSAMPLRTVEALELQSQNALFFSSIAVLERACTIAVHVLACILIFAALRTGKKAFLIEAIVLKTVLDGGIIIMGSANLDPITNVLAQETPVLLLGLVSVFGIMKVVKMKIFETTAGRKG